MFINFKQNSFFLKMFRILFMCLLAMLSIAAHGLSPAAAGGSCSLVAVPASHCSGFSCRRAQAPGAGASGAAAH